MVFALLAVLLAAILANVAQAAEPQQTPPPTPDAIYKRAAADLASVPPAKRRVTRYLSLHAIPRGERGQFLQSLDFVLNATSFRSQIYNPPEVGNDQLLIRIDLEALGWDPEARAARQARLKLSGVDFKLSGEAQRLFTDIWEGFVTADVFFKVTQVDRKGVVNRGWIDPILEERTRLETYSANFLLRADWLLPKLILEKDEGGFYSTLLMLPDNEAQLYKAFGVDEKLVDRDSQLRAGGGVLDGIVALHNRHLQLIPSLYGYDEKFMWRTFDFAKEDRDEVNIFERPGGNLQHDGREIIGSLPNGLHWYYLADGKGKQVAFVPQNIAIDMRPDLRGKIKDRTVHNAYKCMDCHAGGINPFVDVERAAQLNPDIALIVKSKDKRKLAEITQSFEDYYALAEQGGIESKVVRQNESFARRVFAVNNLTPEDNAERINDWFNKYTWALVPPQQAAAEMGLNVDGAIAAWRLSGNSQLVVLSSGQPIRRASWERAFPDAMRAQTYPWEKVIHVKAGH